MKDTEAQATKTFYYRPSMVDIESIVHQAACRKPDAALPTITSPWNAPHLDRAILSPYGMDASGHARERSYY